MKTSIYIEYPKSFDGYENPGQAKVDVDELFAALDPDGEGDFEIEVECSIEEHSNSSGCAEFSRDFTEFELVDFVIANENDKRLNKLFQDYFWAETEEQALEAA